jgi:hypothetical protein
VELKNLTFENELSRNRDSNVKFAPLDAAQRVERLGDIPLRVS